jgi:lipoprotein-anchoring transpeptidase ErfK/SrfK
MVPTDVPGRPGPGHRRSRLSHTRLRVLILTMASVVLVGACGQVNTLRSTGSAPATSPPPASNTDTSYAGHPAATNASPTTSAAAAPQTVLKPGNTGPAVLALQKRLSSLGYWVGQPDGAYGDSTQQAVFALQKAAGLARDGIVGPQTAAALAHGVVAHPKSTSGHLIEIDLSDNILMVVTNGHLDAALNTSTGGGYRYTSRGITSTATTPTGIFHIFRQVDGASNGPLGQLWRPKFFTGGYAIHGAASVPAYPASHGCARLSNEAINWIWANNLAPIGTEVWVY